MELNFETAFAEDAVKSNIDASDWKLGWVQIVGGINGVPTAQQFNEVCFIVDKKANVAYMKAIEALSAAQSAGISLEQAINDISAALNVKADKSEIPTSLPANGGNAATVNSHEVNADVPANAKFTDTTYANMKAATASAAGAAGLVPAPAAGAQAKYLRGDGTWQTPPDTNTTYSAATASAAGLMSAADKAKLDGVAASANNYSHPAYTARTGVPTANVAPAFGGTFTVTQPASDATGHITAMTSRTITIPATAASAAVAGLVSTAAQTFAGNKTFNGQILPAGATAYGTPQARKLASGTAAATTTNCPSGAWYGQHS